MKQNSTTAPVPSIIAASLALVASAQAADTTMTTFDNFTPNALYANWSGATILATTTNYNITATGYGSLWKQVGPINASGNTNIVLDVDLSGTADADGKIGVLISLTDNDNTQYSYRWFGRNRGHHILTGHLWATNFPATDNGVPVTGGAYRIVTNQVGSTPGLDTAILWHVNVELDPSTYNQPYTISLNDLKLSNGTNGTSGGGGGGDTNICAAISTFDNTTLNLAGNWSSQLDTATNIQITATGFGDGWNVCSANTDSNKTLQLNVTLTAPPAANGTLGPIVVLQDGDGTQVQYAWYGQNPGTNIILTKVLNTGNIVSAGSTPGFNFSTISFFHVQLDPSSYGSPYTVAWNDLAVVGCTNSTPVGNDVCAVVDSFDSDFMAGYYGAWNVANEDSGATSLSMTATGFGGGYHGIGPNINTTSNKTLRLNVTLTAPPAANGTLGPIVVLEDGDGTQLRYAFYGQNPGTNILLTSTLSSGINAQAGTTPGFDFTAIAFFHLQVDPSSYAGSYTVSFNNLDIFGCSAVPITITSSSYDRPSGQFTLTWTSEPGANYTVQYTTDLQSGFSDLVNGVPSAGSTTTISVVLNDPDKSFVRIRKQ